MQYSNIHKIRFSQNLDLAAIKSMVESATTDWVLLADETYRIIYRDEQPIEFDTHDSSAVFVPQILPYSTTIDGPFGRIIRHISISANLKTQPVMVGHDVRPDFIPFAMIVNRQVLLDLLQICRDASNLFLELSLLLADLVYTPRVHQHWLATVQLRDADVNARASMIARYFPSGKKYLMSTELVEVPSCERIVVNNKNKCRDGFINFFNAIYGRKVLLTQYYSAEYQLLQYDNITISLDPSIDADYYIALPGAVLSSFDLYRTITQIVLPDHNSISSICTSDCALLGTFPVKQFTSSVHFAPPFSTSSSNMLTAIEIILSCAPKSILIDSNDMLGYLMAAGDGSESIKRQVFMTRIVEYATSRGISLKILGDLCLLN